MHTIIHKKYLDRQLRRNIIYKTAEAYPMYFFCNARFHERVCLHRHKYIFT